MRILCRILSILFLSSSAGLYHAAVLFDEFAVSLIIGGVSFLYIGGLLGFLSLPDELTNKLDELLGLR